MELSFRIKKSTAFVFDCLTDMQKFVLVHPVITQIDNIEHETYLVHETLTFGFIPFSFTYRATVEKNEEEKSVIIRATVFRLTKIEMKFTLITDLAYTIIKEQILFDTMAPVKPIMAKIFRKQHTELFKNIELANQ